MIECGDHIASRTVNWWRIKILKGQPQTRRCSAGRPPLNGTKIL